MQEHDWAKARKNGCKLRVEQQASEQASRQAGKQASGQAGKQARVARLRREGLLDVLLDAPQEVRPEHLVQLGHLFSWPSTWRRVWARAQKKARQAEAGKSQRWSQSPPTTQNRQRRGIFSKRHETTNTTGSRGDEGREGENYTITT